MALSAAVIAELVAAGLTGEALVSACQRIEAAAPGATRRSAGPYRRVLPRNWGEMRQSVYQRDGGRCRYCNRILTLQTMQCDHVEPLARGGLSVIENLAAACKSCNSSKRDRSVSEWRR